jgi:hypothetical protein
MHGGKLLMLIEFTSALLKSCFVPKLTTGKLANEVPVSCAFHTASFVLSVSHNRCFFFRVDGNDVLI